jgi:predicted HicB family RNase H-like nuclease
MQNTATKTAKRGRPATGSKTVKLSASIQPDLLAEISKAAFANQESLSRFVSRALQAALKP